VKADQLCDAPLVQVASALRRRQVSPVELVDAYLERIDATRRLNAFITVTPERARREARRAEKQLARNQPGPLLGVPLAIKDLFSTRGVRTTAGSRILQDWIPRRDATAVARLRTAGAILLGKTNLHEFAYGVTTANPHWGVARNPRDQQRTPGGSSGGSAIAVVAGLCAGSVGSDTGGSIRIPAALCGCVGLKPTFGAVPLDGVIPLGWSLDHAGPISHTVADAGVLFEVMAARPAAGTAGRRLRIGVPQEFFFEGVDPGVARAVRTAIDELRGAGLRIRAVKLPEMELSVAAQLVTLRAEALAYHARWIRSHPRSYGRDTRVRLQLGTLVAASDYVLAQRARELMRGALRRVFAEVDLLATPTVPITAPRLGERSVRLGRQEEPVDGTLVRLTQAFNLTGVPALSVPCGLSSGLPVGIQLAAPWDEEGRLLSVGILLEKVLGRGTRLSRVEVQAITSK
jgi:aspartyl-tRNA(Asn)/glutamyl-tRNA(Gln) amidotransferase subunit A